MPRRAADTSLGGSARRFPDTKEDLVGRFRSTDEKEFQAALEMLCRQYWKPIYSYARAAWAKTNEDAKDLTQAFFVWLQDGEVLRRFEPDRGSFRRYIKTILKRFIGHHEVALKRLKRGGGVKIVSLDEHAPSLEELVKEPQQAEPDEIFEQVWASQIVGEAIERVKARYIKDKKEIQFRVYELYDFVPDTDRPTYKELEKQLKLGPREIKNYLFKVREEVRSEIRNELAALTRDDKELASEWGALFGV